MPIYEELILRCLALKKRTRSSVVGISISEIWDFAHQDIPNGQPATRLSYGEIYKHLVILREKGKVVMVRRGFYYITSLGLKLLEPNPSEGF